MYLRYYNFEQMQDKRWKNTLLMWKLTKKGLKQTLLAPRTTPIIRGEFIILGKCLPDKGGCSVERSETRWVCLQ